MFGFVMAVVFVFAFVVVVVVVEVLTGGNLQKNCLDSFLTKTVFEHISCTHFIRQTQRQDVCRRVCTQVGG